MDAVLQNKSFIEQIFLRATRYHMIQMSLEFVPQGPITTSGQISDTPLLKPMVVYFTDSHMFHSA